MLTTKIINGSNVIHFSINDGNLQTAISDVIDQLELISQNADSTIYMLGIFEDIKGFKGFRAFWKMVKSRFAMLENLKKYALLIDKSWLQQQGSITDFFIPGIDIQVFDPTQEEEAMAWFLDSETV